MFSLFADREVGISSHLVVEVLKVRDSVKGQRFGRNNVEAFCLLMRLSLVVRNDDVLIFYLAAMMRGVEFRQPLKIACVVFSNCFT